MKVVNDFKDYQLLDMARGKKLEKWQNVILLRPDPQIIWEENLKLKETITMRRIIYIEKCNNRPHMRKLIFYKLLRK